jgi:hypothetical protein
MIVHFDRRLLTKFIVGVIGIAVNLSQCLAQIPGRTTDSIAQDTINGMIATRDFDSAKWYCERLFEQSEPTSDDAAKAAIDFFRVQLAYLRDTSQLNEDSLRKNTESTWQYFESYADHRRYRWWQAIQWEGQRWIAETLVAEVLIDASKVSAVEVSRQLVRIASGIDELRKQIEEDRASLAAKSSAKSQDANRTPPEDLIVLDRQLAVDRVRISILQTELYAPGSEEQIASATTAAETADATLQKLQRQSEAWKTISLMRVIALRRAGQINLARKEFATLSGESDLGKSTAIDLDLADDELDSANKRLSVYYGNDPQTAPASPTMDLIRLQWLIQSKADSQTVSQWLESMRRRNGPYNHRRGEAILLSMTKSDGVSIAAENPFITAARARLFLRQGDLRQGSRWLSAAARATNNPKDALSLAIEASAANMKSSLAPDAIEVLLDVSRRFASEANKEFADLHYQAIYLSAHATKSDQVEPLLKEHLAIFRESAHAESARQWLMNLFDQSDRPVEAASIAIGDDSDRRWRALTLNSQFDLYQISRQLVDSIADIGDTSKKNRRTDLAIELANWNDAKSLTPVSERAKNIASFRSGQSDELPENILSIETRSLAHRLIQDGASESLRRQAIAKCVLSCRDKLEPQDSRLVLTALIWDGQDDEAIKTLDVFLGDKPTARSMQETAHALAQSARPETRRKAIEIYDQLSAKLPRGIPQWHQAKCDAIDILLKLSPEEAEKRAKYILLTQSEIPEPYRAKYEIIAK